MIRSIVPHEVVVRYTGIGENWKPTELGGKLWDALVEAAVKRVLETGRTEAVVLEWASLRARPDWLRAIVSLWSPLPTVSLVKSAEWIAMRNNGSFRPRDVEILSFQRGFGERSPIQGEIYVREFSFEGARVRLTNRCRGWS